MPLVLFYRDFREFTGGHLKTWHYFNHVASVPGHHAVIYFTPQSRWDDSNPWYRSKSQILESLDAVRPDILFLAGLDWQGISRLHRPEIPVINLLQGMRHADSADQRYTFLSHRAVRICVSQDVAEAVCQTGQSNGPVFTIPNGIDINALQTIAAEKKYECDVLISAMKQPHLGQKLLEKIQKRTSSVRLLDRPVHREEYLRNVASAAITVYLPWPKEGYYLPALEGMILGTLVICPDCIGNRSFCLPEHNCLRPHYDKRSLLEAVNIALAMHPDERASMLHRARETGLQHDMAREREAFVKILKDINYLWRN